MAAPGYKEDSVDANDVQNWCSTIYLSNNITHTSASSPNWLKHINPGIVSQKIVAEINDNKRNIPEKVWCIIDEYRSMYKDLGCDGE